MWSNLQFGYNNSALLIKVTYTSSRIYFLRSFLRILIYMWLVTVCQNTELLTLYGIISPLLSFLRDGWNQQRFDMKDQYELCINTHVAPTVCCWTVSFCFMVKRQSFDYIPRYWSLFTILEKTSYINLDYVCKVCCYLYIKCLPKSSRTASKTIP